MLYTTTSVAWKISCDFNLQTTSISQSSSSPLFIMFKPSAILIHLEKPCNKKCAPWLPSLYPSGMIWPKPSCEWVKRIGERKWQKTLVSISALRNLSSFVFPTLNRQFILETDNVIFLKEDSRHWKPTFFESQRTQQYPGPCKKF